MKLNEKTPNLQKKAEPSRILVGKWRHGANGLFNGKRTRAQLPLVWN